MGWGVGIRGTQGGHRVTLDKKRKLPLGKHTIQQHIEDVKQGQKIVTDLLEWTMEPNDPVKEESQRKRMNRSQYGYKIKPRIMACVFRMSGRITDSRRRPTSQASLVIFKPICHNGFPGLRKFTKCGF